MPWAGVDSSIGRAWTARVATSSPRAPREMTLDILHVLRERGDVTAVVIKPCTSFRDKTMYVKVCAALVVAQIWGGMALAANDPKDPPAPFNPFQGTPEEQRACRPDVMKMCKEQLGQNDNTVVLRCLQANKVRLSAPCHGVLAHYGQI